MVFLAILKIVLLAILYILAAIAVLLILIAFCRLRYEVSAEKGDEVIASARVSWFFGLVRMRYTFTNGNSKAKLKILFFEILDKKEKKQNPGVMRRFFRMTWRSFSKIISMFKRKRPNKPANLDKNNNTVNEPSISDNSRDEYIKPDAGDKEGKLSIRKKIFQKINNFFEKLKAFKEKIKNILDYPDRDEIILYTKELLVSLIKALGLKKYKISAVVGFDDPSSTGKLIGLTYAVNSIVGLNINISGAFDRKVFEAKGQAKGSTSLWSFFWPLLKYIRKKPIWNIIKKMMKRKGA